MPFIFGVYLVLILNIRDKILLWTLFWKNSFNLTLSSKIKNWYWSAKISTSFNSSVFLVLDHASIIDNSFTSYLTPQLFVHDWNWTLDLRDALWSISFKGYPFWILTLRDSFFSRNVTESISCKGYWCSSISIKGCSIWSLSLVFCYFVQHNIIVHYEYQY